MQFTYSCVYRIGEAGQWKSFERTFKAESIEAGMQRGRSMLGRSTKYKELSITKEKLIEAGV